MAIALRVAVWSLLLPCFQLLVAAVPIPANSSFACYRTKFQFKPTNWDQAITLEESARLYLEKHWTPAEPSTFPLTIITHTSINRWKQLRAQCRSWKGPLIASVYLYLRQNNGTWLNEPNKELVAAQIRLLDELHESMNKGTGCQLTMMFFWEVYEEDAYLLYPYNTLRNYAILQAQTPMIAMVDVDLLLSQGLSQEMTQKKAIDNMLAATQQKFIFILPAFEAFHDGQPNLAKEVQMANLAIRYDKAGLKDMRDRSMLRGFHSVKYAVGHRATDFNRWFQTTEPYEVRYEWEYEPWFIVSRMGNPYYDIRFRGYFYDKVLHAAHLHVYGYKFMTHPNQFIVHRNHPESEVYSNHATWLKLLNILHDKAKGALHDMNTRRYIPRIDETTKLCESLLPWWAGHQPIAL